MLLKNLLWLFGKEKIAEIIASLDPLQTTVLDTVFKTRKQKHTPLVAVKDIIKVTQTTPVVGRGSASVPIKGGESTHSWIEPLALNPSDFASGADLNNLKAQNNATKEVWLSDVIEELRRILKLSTEGIASTALTGTIDWPLQISEGVFKRYQVKFADKQIVTLDAEEAFDHTNASVMKAYNVFRKIKKVLTSKGFGGKLEIWAGENVYTKLLGLVDSWKSTAKLKVEKKDNGLDIAGFFVKEMDETFTDPETEKAVNKVDPDMICMMALDGGHSLLYCSLDDIDANLLAWPMFFKPIEHKNPSGVEVLGMSKPLPVPNSRAICWAKATNL